MSYYEGQISRQKGINLNSFETDYCVIDTETTGLSSSFCEIIEISALKIRNNTIIDKFSTLVKPSEPITEFITKLTGITNDMVSDAPTIDIVIKSFVDFVATDILVGHNVTFDLRFLNENTKKYLDDILHNDYVDTLALAKKFVPELPNHKLITVANSFGIKPNIAHRSLSDCETTFEIYKKLADESLVYEEKFVKQFENANKDFQNKNIVFKGTTTLCSHKSFNKICDIIGANYYDILYKDKTDILVLGKFTFKKYKNGDYSETMKVVSEYEHQGLIRVMSEFDFVRTLGIAVSSSTKKSIIIKSMHANTTDFAESHPLYGKVCVFTGTLKKMVRNDAKQIVLDYGGDIGNSVNKNTNYLILGKLNSDSTKKIEKAEELKLKGQDLQIIDEELFYTMIEEGEQFC